jgi:hypothetical protein
MCGRFTLRTSAQEVAKTFGLLEVPDLRLRYNVAPTQQVLTITLQDGKRHGQLRRWGLVPSWADDRKIGYRLINARAETVAAKPSAASSGRSSDAADPGFLCTDPICLFAAGGRNFANAASKLEVPVCFRISFS